MSLNHHARPTPANIRTRLNRISDAAESGAKLAKRWNPKGRWFYAQREIIRFCEEAERKADELLALMNR